MGCSWQAAKPLRLSPVARVAAPSPAFRVGGPPGHPLRLVWSPQVYWQNSKSEVRGMWFYDLRELNQISQSMQQ